MIIFITLLAIWYGLQATGWWMIESDFAESELVEDGLVDYYETHLWYRMFVLVVFPLAVYIYNRSDRNG